MKPSLRLPLCFASLLSLVLLGAVLQGCGLSRSHLQRGEARGEAPGGGAGSAEAPAQSTRHALLISVEEYQDRRATPLPTTAAEARKLAQTLQEAAGFAAQNTRVLTSHEEFKATRANILSELQALASRVQPDDVVWVFISTHGMEMDRTVYLMPWDADLSSVAAGRRTGLSTDAITKVLSKLPVKTLIVAYDMCRIDPRRSLLDRGGVNDLSESSSEQQVKKVAVKPPLAGAEQGPRVAITLFSANSGQLAAISRKREMSYFSYFLQEGLRGGAADGHGVVRLKNLLPYPLVISDFPKVARGYPPPVLTLPPVQNRGMGLARLVNFTSRDQSLKGSFAS